MKYKDWVICDLKVADDLRLTGNASRMGARFEFRIDLVQFVGGSWGLSVGDVFGVPGNEAEGIALDFADERIRGAAQSVIDSAMDRLNDYILDELEGVE